ncbi:RCC1-like domain-containing protein [Plantactinospora sp. CA-294935]|uniref:RCC1-like domain-containing protein n=1 Tax=Plantactinospora sp. CA-294935 TaxID=3240012 RepID=UPI003D9217A7
MPQVRSSGPTRTVIPDRLTVRFAHQAILWSVADTSTGQAYIWGNNAYGQLGNGGNVDCSARHRPCVAGLRNGTARSRGYPAR